MARSLVEQLVKNRRMETERQVEQFEMALEELREEDPPLRALYGAFDDETECPEVMWGLIHYLDTCEPFATIKALIAQTSVLAEQAPEWMQILHTRLTNGETTAAVYHEELAHASPEVKETIERILQAL